MVKTSGEMKLRVGKLVFAVFFFIITNSISVNAQRFKADRYGYVADSEFLNLIKQRNYQLVSAFDTSVIESQKVLLATVLKDGKPYHLDLDGNELPYRDGSLTFAQRQTLRLRDPHAIAERKYKELVWGWNTRYELSKVGDLSGIIRKSDGMVILPAEYQWAQCHPANFITFKKAGKYGIADTTGKIFIKPEYDWIDACMVDTTKIDLFIASKAGLVTLINQDGKVLFPPKYNKITTNAVSGVLISIVSDKGQPKYGLISKQGKILLEPYCRDFVTINNSNFFRSENGSKMGLVTKQGKIILEPIYDNVSSSVYAGFISFSKGQKNGLVDSTGRIALDTIYNDVLVDSTNKVIRVGIKQKSDKPFSEYKYGLIDYKRNFKTQIVYDELRPFGNRYLAKKSERYSLVDFNGKTLRDFPYTYIQQVNGYFIAVDDKHRYGVIDPLGKIMIPFEHTNIHAIGGYYFATENGIYTIDNQRVMAGNTSNLSFTNNLPFRKHGIFVFRQFGEELFADRYGNRYKLKNVN